MEIRDWNQQPVFASRLLAKQSNKEETRDWDRDYGVWGKHNP